MIRCNCDFCHLRIHVQYVRLCIQNGVQDRFDPFIMTYGLMIPQPSIATGNGNLAPESFDNYPVLQTSGTTRLQVSQPPAATLSDGRWLRTI